MQDQHLKAEKLRQALKFDLDVANLEILKL
jgi:hypothetical protein